MKKIISLAIVAVMLLAIVPFSVFNVNAETDSQGLTFTLKEGFSETYYILTKCPANATSVVIPEVFNGYPVRVIQSDALAACENLTSINIPASVTEIKPGAIQSCSSLTTLTVSSGNTVYYSASNCIIEKETGRLAVGCKNSKIPTDGSVTIIGEYSFYRCDGLKKIVATPTDEANVLYIPNTVTVIENDAFSLCPDLTSVVLPDSVEAIKNHAFDFCDALVSVRFGNGLTSIGDYCFYYSENLSDVVIPETVDSIGNYCFYDCESLTDIYFESDTLPSHLGTNWRDEATTEEHMNYAPPHTHAAVGAWKSDATSHWHNCSCGEKMDQKSHDSGKWFITEDAKVGKEGKKELRCTVCQYVLNTDTIPALKDETPDEPVKPQDGNIAFNKTYTTSGIYSDEAGTPYPDEGNKTLTDGVIADLESGYDNTAFVGFNTQTAEYTTDGAYVIVNLGDVYSLNKLVARVSSKNEMNTGASVHVIKNVEFLVSKDGKTWTSVGSVAPAASAAENNTSATLTLTKAVVGQYVQYKFTSETSWMMVSEVEAYGEKYTAPVEPPKDEDPVDPPKDEDPVDPPKDDEEPDDYMLGDINESGEIDSMDYILLKRNYFGTYKFTERQFKIGDITQNGEIDSMDYILLKRAYFGTYTIQ